MWYSNWGVAPSACRGYILWQWVHRIIWKEQEGDRGNYRVQGGWQRIVEQNRIKLLMMDQWCHHKRLTIIRTKARGNILGRKEIVAGDKGEHSYYKWKRRGLCGAKESIAWQRNNKGTGRLWRSFYRGAGFCRVTGSWHIVEERKETHTVILRSFNENCSCVHKIVVLYCSVCDTVEE